MHSPVRPGGKCCLVVSFTGRNYVVSRATGRKLMEKMDEIDRRGMEGEEWRWGLREDGEGEDGGADNTD